MLEAEVVRKPAASATSGLATSGLDGDSRRREIAIKAGSMPAIEQKLQDARTKPLVQ